MNSSKIDAHALRAIRRSICGHFRKPPKDHNQALPCPGCAWREPCDGMLADVVKMTAEFAVKREDSPKR